jgi:hypothetical protein
MRRASLVTHSAAGRNTQKFIVFVNMLVNDATFLLDESFTKLHAIYEHERLRASPEWAQLNMVRDNSSFVLSWSCPTVRG